MIFSSAKVGLKVLSSFWQTLEVVGLKLSSSENALMKITRSASIPVFKYDWSTGVEIHVNFWFLNFKREV